MGNTKIRPAPPEVRDDDRYQWVAVEAERWLAGGDGKQCRRLSAGERCLSDAVAQLNRAGRGRRSSWWSYCERHMYGKWIENGRVMHWILRPISETNG